MTFLVTGACGQLGRDVIDEIIKRNHKCIGVDIACVSFSKKNVQFYTADITNEEEIDKIVESVLPDVIIHCAAWTAVDLAEEEENREKVYSINVNGTQNIAVSAKKYNCKLIYISTDYVFSGEGNTPWQEDSTIYDPINYYGQTKLDGEKTVSSILEKFFIVRISWVFGKHGKNFVKTMLNLSKTHTELRVVNDQIGNPTYTLDLSSLLVDMGESDKYGYYHATNEGESISWYDFACEIFKYKGIDTKVIPVTTQEYGVSKAKRPFNSRLKKDKIKKNGFVPLPHWKDALERFLKEIGD